MSVNNEKPTKIEFIQYHQPALKDGEYQIAVSQTIAVNGRIPKDTEFGPPVKTFFVAGQRFHLDPQDIHAVFPPDHSLGDHSNVLPHIVLNRSTLPWERMAIPGDKKT
nr:hypothetical protein [Candidatus Aminicenantes bacterium]NIM82051.1 hypothetical protein [Candidatus Aminicenantes bacterium]NIN21449.1 hypothetical protein [Candidatus Aminicenantes bacterium]NIN45261.1 hypothetical protein [Candidatus Aminicenantes bacterium]NIN88078.1 hypothetical protein [Candidatus Aminicenantes bacterium]